MSRPSRSAKFNALIAFWASAAVCISMNALRRLIPVAESRSSLTDNTVPNLPNLPARVSSVAESGRLFTWSLVLTVGPLVGERQRIRLAPVYRKSDALARLVAGRQHTARPRLVVGVELARPVGRASPSGLVEAAGIEPASASAPPSALHAYSRLLF